jgi:hypothetical protein
MQYCLAWKETEQYDPYTKEQTANEDQPQIVPDGIWTDITLLLLFDLLGFANVAFFTNWRFMSTLYQTHLSVPILQ